MNFKSALLSTVVALGTASAAFAAPVTTNSFVNSGSYDFSTDYGNTIGPVAFAIGTTTGTYTSTGDGYLGYNGGWGLGDNGLWSGLGGFAGINNTGSAAMSFSFANAVSAVGGFMNYAPTFYGDAVISIFGAGDVLLESLVLNNDAPISTPGGTNAGAFRGFERASADIFRFEVKGAYSVIDDLVIGSTVAAVPLPASLPLLAAGIGAMGLARRRRKTA
jgi:hypothetical protein